METLCEFIREEMDNEIRYTINDIGLRQFQKMTENTML